MFKVNRTTAILAASILATTLSACGSNSLFNRDRPDEMMVSRQAPLVVPPDFSLAPPAPGTARPGGERSKEHTSELKSLMRNSYAVFCLKNKKQNNGIKYRHKT